MHKEKQQDKLLFQPQEQLDRFASQVTGIMGGMRGTGTATTNAPNPTPLQSASRYWINTCRIIFRKVNLIMMNRILKRPMFRRGGSAGTGITSGLDKPGRQEYSVAGRVTEGIDPYISDVEKVFQAREVVPNFGGLTPETLPQILN